MRHNIRLVLAFSIATVAVAWLALMVSYWLPEPAGHALMATALAMGVPALIAGAACFIFETEIIEELEKRNRAVQRTHPLRCTDCQNKILNAGGTTIGDQIEGELMAGEWKPPPDSPFDRKGR
jgi:hypothetical protein